MLVGLLSDAHGNPLGVDTCLTVLERAGADRIHFLGDAVGYLPGERGVLRTLRDRNVLCQRGNHDAMLLGTLAIDPERERVYGLASARARLSDRDLVDLRTWPDSRDVSLDDDRVLCVHGSPRDPLCDYVYPDSQLDWLEGLGYAAVFMGHTHRPFVDRRENVLIVNVGSCGLPRDQGDLMACALYDTTTNTCEILRVKIPVAAVLAQFDAAIHPSVIATLERQTPNPVGTIVTI